MSGFNIYGHCPGALRPMDSGDGLVVRIRPPLGRLTPAQARGLAEAAAQFGTGNLELTSRANLQIRGIPEAAHPALIGALSALGLVDPDPAAERARNLIVTPFHWAGDGTMELAGALTETLLTAPSLPAKFGLALDCGRAPVLRDTAADIRIERDAGGRLLIRPDGLSEGQLTTASEAPGAVLSLLRWFADHGVGADGRGRMRDAAARLTSFRAQAAPAPAATTPPAGPAEGGLLVAAPFGLLPAKALAALADHASELRLTPWRALFLPDSPDLPALPDVPGLITDPGDPLLRISACTGAPGCPQALAATRPLARSLAAHLPPGQRLHVSGCAKGCAHPDPTEITLTATPEGFSLAHHARAADPPERRGLSPQTLLASPSLLTRTDDAPSL
jgi:precorrin-3B synthase